MTGRRTVLPRHFADELRKERKSLAAEIIREIRLHVPEFSRPLTGQFGAGMQSGVETALAEFADLVEGRAAGDDAFPCSSDALGEEHLRVYRALGRGELAEGRSLDALQAAYRLGARVAWRRYADVARRAGLGPDLVVVLAEAVFAHIDEIASVSVQGYVEAKADRAGSLGRRRHRLLDLLAAGAPVEEVRQAAADADWPLPARIAGVVFGPAAADGEHRAHLPALVLADLHAPEPCLLLPNRRAACATARSGRCCTAAAPSSGRRCRSTGRPTRCAGPARPGRRCPRGSDRRRCSATAGCPTCCCSATRPWCG